MASPAIVNHQVATHAGFLVVDKIEHQQREPEATLTQARVEEALERIEDLSVATAAEYELACAEMVRLKTLIKEAKDRFDPICAKAFEAHREATKQRGVILEPLETAVKRLDPKLAKYLADQRVAQEAEQQRLLEEARLDALALREAEIEEAEADGAAPEEIAALCEQPLEVVPMMRTYSSCAKSPVSLRESYKGRVTNRLAFIRHIAAHPEYLNLLVEDQAAINRLCASLKSNLQIDGLEVYKEQSTATRTVAARRAR